MSSVTRIVHDRLGFAWLGTDEGLLRYDGHSTVVIRHRAFDSTSLSDNTITALALDSSGNLWVGTEYGLNWLNTSTREARAFYHDASEPNSIPHHLITGIVVDTAGKVWVGTEGGLCQWDEKIQGFRNIGVKRLSDTGPLQVRCLYVSHSGVVWVGSRREGVLTYNSSLDMLEPVLSARNEMPLPTVWDIDEDAAGNMWMGSPNGLWRLDVGSGVWTQWRPDGKTGISHERVRTVRVDLRGFVWAGTTAGGINCFDPKTERWYNYRTQPLDARTFRVEPIHDIVLDASGLLWVGSETAGVILIDPGDEGFGTVVRQRVNPHSIGGDIVRCFLVDQTGTLWIGTDEGLDRLDPVTGGFRHYTTATHRLADNQIRALHQDEHGFIWIGTEIAGMMRLNPTTDEVVHYPNTGVYGKEGLVGSRVYAFLEDRERDELWIATFRGGLNRLDLKTGDFSHFEAASHVPGNINDVYTLVEDRQGLIWLGSRRDGLYTFDKRTERFGYFRHDPHDPTSISDNRIRILHEDKNGRLWIGTASGLNRFENGRFVRYGPAHGLPETDIQGILNDETGHLWISTAHGLLRMDLRTGMVRHFSAQDGLHNDRFERGACYKASDGTMFFGGLGGYTYFRSNRIGFNSTPPRVVLTNFRVADRDLPLSADPNSLEVIELEHDQNFFSFEFTALNFRSPDKNLYAYRLEGVDDSWNYARDRRVANYTNIAPGKYQFHVKAANSDGVWNETGKKVSIWIHPPWWATWWFRLVMGLLIVVTAFWIHRIRIRQIAERNRRLERVVRERTRELLVKSQEVAVARDKLEIKVAERTMQLQNLSDRLQVIREDERHHLSREIHDELGSQLTALKMEIGLLGPDANGEQTQSLAKMTDEAIRTVQRISKELRPAILDDLGLGDALIWQIEEFAKRSQIRCDSDIDPEIHLPPNLAIVVFRIFQEILTNVSRHSGADELRIRVDLTGDEFRLIALDNGRGITQDEFDDPKSLGLIGIRERLRPWNGSFVAHSFGRGTRVEIKIKILPEWWDS